MKKEKIIKIFFKLEIENEKDTSDPNEIKIEINRFFKNLFAKTLLKSLPQINDFFENSPMPIGGAQMRKTSETRPIFWVRTFCLVNDEKP